MNVTVPLTDLSDEALERREALYIRLLLQQPYYSKIAARGTYQ